MKFYNLIIFKNCFLFLIFFMKIKINKKLLYNKIKILIMLLADTVIGVVIATLCLYVIYMCSNGKFCSMDCILAGIALTMVVIVYYVYMNKYYGKVGFQAPVNYHIENVFTGMSSLPNKMFPYDNLTESELLNSVVTHNPEDGSLSNPINLANMEHTLVNPVYFSPVGTPHNLKLDPNQDAMKPSVNGLKDGPRALAMFAYNVFKPECCPSPYSGDRGCVCMTKEQKEYLQRGGSVV